MSKILYTSFPVTLSAVVHIDTEIADVHTQNLEAKVTDIASVASTTVGETNIPTINQLIAAPTFAYSSGEEIRASASVSQIWNI